MTQIIAIYGKTCSLKTDVSREISRMTGFKVVSRGELATTRAKAKALPTAAHLPLDIHKGIDEETLRVAELDEPLLIMESGFMDAALGPRENVFFVHLSATDDARNARWDKRKEEGGGRTRQLGESVTQRDTEDTELRTKLYGGETSTVKPALDLDTSERSAEDIATEILEAFQAEAGVQITSGRPEMDKAAAKGVNPGATGGQVKSYNPDRAPFGGYLTDDKSGQDIFVHKSALADSGLSELEAGTRVAFDIVEDGFGGFKAINIKPA